MEAPSLDAWLAEAKAAPEAELCGMYLTHCGVVRATAKAQARQGAEGLPPVDAMDFTYDAEGVARAAAQARRGPGVHYVRVWLNQGHLNVGDTLMLVLVGADIRPHCIDALERLVETIKSQLVVEHEVFADAEGAGDAGSAGGTGGTGSAESDGEGATW